MSGRCWRVGAGLVMTAALLAASVGGASASDGALHLQATGCKEVQMSVSVPTSNVRAEVAEPFVPLESAPGSGIASLAIGVRRCASLSVDDRRAADVSIAEVGVMVEPPATAPASAPGARHFYQLWSLSSSARISKALVKLGLAGGHVADLCLSDDALGGNVRAPWKPSPYSYAVVAPGDELVESGPVTFIWWHDGPRGRIRSTYAFPAEMVRVGSAVLTAAPGSRLAQIAGGTRVAGLGAVIQLPHYSGELEVLPR